MPNYRNMPITKTTAEEDVLRILMAMSAGITPESLMAALQTLPRNSNTKLLGSFAVGCAVSAKKAIEVHMKNSNLDCPSGFKINNDINFSMFLLLGHVMMLFDEEDLGQVGREIKPAYMDSLCGKRNLKDYGPNGTIPGKEVKAGGGDGRAIILRKWAAMLSQFDPKPYQPILAKLFPHIVKDKRGVLSRSFGNVASSVMVVFLAPYKTIRAVIKFIYNNMFWPIILVTVWATFMLLAGSFAPIAKEAILLDTKLNGTFLEVNEPSDVITVAKTVAFDYPYAAVLAAIGIIPNSYTFIAEEMAIATELGPGYGPVFLDRMNAKVKGYLAARMNIVPENNETGYSHLIPAFVAYLTPDLSFVRVKEYIKAVQAEAQDEPGGGQDPGEEPGAEVEGATQEETASEGEAGLADEEASGEEPEEEVGFDSFL